MDYFLSFLNPAIIISIISLLVGAFITLRTYQVTKQKKEFEQKHQMRSLLKEYLLFDANYKSGIKKLSLSLAKATSIEEIKYINHTPILLDFINSNSLTNFNKKTSSIINSIYEHHQRNILLRNLYIYSFKDALQQYSKTFNDYEKTIIYKTIVYVYINDKKFYQSLKNKCDYENQFRLGLQLIEAELKNGMLSAAEKRYREISDSVLTNKVRMSKATVARQLKQIELSLKEANDCIATL